MKIALPYGNNYHHPSEILNFTGTDTKDAYIKNSRLLADIDWKWRDHKIEYRLNNLRFRCDFDLSDDFDFSDYVVVLGCSHIMGVGNMTHETVTSVLANGLNKKVINMGVGGGSNSLIYNNLMWLLSRKYRPLRIVVCWTSLYRELYMDSDLNMHQINLHNMHDQFVNYYTSQYITDYIERDAFMKFEMVNKMKDVGVYSFNFFNYWEYKVDDGLKNAKKLKDVFLEHHNFGNSALREFHISRLNAINDGVVSSDVINNYFARDIQGLDHLRNLHQVHSHYPAAANIAIAKFISKNIGL